MPQKSGRGCVDVRPFLPEFVTGELKASGRTREVTRVAAHVKVCPKCRNYVLDHANRTVTIPMIKQISRRTGLRPKQVLQALKLKLLNP